MIFNNLKIIWRRMIHQKMYSIIKIGGFALGIAVCLLIALFISDELSYDKHHPDSERLFRVVLCYHANGQVFKGAAFPAPFARALKENYPDVELAGRLNGTVFWGAGSNEIRPVDQAQNTHENGFAYADQELLDIFRFPLIYGDAAHALDEPNTIVISKRKAEKYFADEVPIGKTLIINNDESKIYRITGVMENPPKNSHFQNDFLLSIEGGFYPGEQTNWTSSSYNTYVMLKPGTDVTALEAKFSDIVKKYIIPNEKRNGQADADKLADIVKYELQPVEDIHLKSEGIQDDLSHGDIRFVWLFGIIAIIILIIACINFINLSTARSANKGREAGLRKAIGAFKSNLVRQFLSESLFFSFISFILGGLLTTALLPYFNVLSAKSMSIPWEGWWWILPSLILFATIIGVLTGLYPSFYLSSFKPAAVLKGELNRGSKGSKMRSGLVIFQFTVSIVLIIGTLIIYRQMNFILNKKVGFEKDQVVLLHGTNTLGNKAKTFKNELLKLVDVENVTISSFLPIDGTRRDGNALWIEGRKNIDDPTSGQFWKVDHDYIKTLGMKIVEGRDFNNELASDANAAIINRVLAKELGLAEPFVGKKIANMWNTFEVIGVVEDFNYESLKRDIGGICMTLGKSRDIISVKVKTSDMVGTIESITSVWNRFSVNQPIRYSFLDESFAMMYNDVLSMGRIFSTFALFAIIVACLGLFALSSFMIEQRIKEIGIRKVNGARISEILAKLNKDFIKWVAIAFVLACPIAYYTMNKWLENFAYKTSISWWIFTLVGILAFGIALLTVSWQSWRAATRNPVEALRYE